MGLYHMYLYGKNLTQCKLWFLTSGKVSNYVYIPKKPQQQQQQQEKWLFPHPNESIHAYRNGKVMIVKTENFRPFPPATLITF